MTGKQLKNSILQWAIQGKLVPQDPNDEPASVLLEKIRAEKARLVKEGKLKKKDLEVKPIAEDEIPFEIPKGWEWVRWGELGEYKKGPFGSSLTKSMFVPNTDEAVKVYEQKNAIQKDYSLGEYYISKEKYEAMTGFTVRPGDIIVSCAGTIGETYLLPSEAPIGIINQALMRAKLHLDSIIPYWLLYFQYILLVENKLKGSGSAIKNIPPFEVLKAMPVPLPPLAEQHRIVAKIEELMPLVEKYGETQEALEEWNNSLPEKLKKSILQEAIQGKLVPQDPADEPASALLERIREEKQRLVKEGKLKKKDLEVKPITEDEIPFEIPESWAWVRVFDVFKINPKVEAKDDQLAAFIPMEKIVACYGSQFSYDIRKWGEIKKTFTCFADGDVAFAKITPCFQNRKSMILDGLPDGIGAGTTELKVLRQYSETIDRKYLLFFLESSYFIDEAIFKGTANQQRIVVGYLENKPFPLPPLAEQRRIVAKIEKLIHEIDKLKA